MNRTITRLLGFCVAFVSTGVGINTAAVAMPQLPGYCQYREVGQAGGAIYQKLDCKIFLTGWTASNIYMSNIPFGMCTGDQLVEFTGCIDGWCNITGIFCEDRNSFVDIGCTEGPPGDSYCNYQSGWINTTMDEDGYYFEGCGTGWYQNPGPSGNALVPFSPDMSGLAANCGPCSGMHFANNRFETFVNDGGFFSLNGFVWDSNGGSGIESCRAWGPGGVMKNTAGTFVLSSEGCPYVN